MIGEALHARIPLIEVRTSDPVCVADTIHHYTKRTPRLWPSKGEITEGDVFIIYEKMPHGEDAAGLYLAMANAGASAVIVNPEHPVPMSYDTGSFVVPPELLLAELTRASVDQSVGIGMVDALEGLTPLEVRWLIALVQGAGKKVTLSTLRSTRISHSPPTRGLSPVSTKMDFYVPDEQVAAWVGLSGLFVNHEDRRLRPRGLLFDGEPGTGKTMAAKFIARELELPLYRLEIGSVKSKFVGESEKLLADALATIDRYAPVVLLIDEAEKILTGSSKGDSGTSSALLGQLLWWLQEHRSTVLTLMTTNNLSEIPRELYRPGRIDEVITILPLLSANAVFNFIHEVAAEFPEHNTDKFVARVWGAMKHTSKATPAECVAIVTKHVKLDILEQKKNYTVKEAS